MPPIFKTEVEITPAEDSIGERLFLDPRFAQYFATHMTGVNQPLAMGDPVVSTVNAADGTLPGLAIPSLAERSQNHDLYLPVTANHPNASERFRRAADGSNPAYADLGVWNVYLNPDMPNPQSTLKSLLCSAGVDCSVDRGLGNTIAQFKTPTLRDLEDSAPYFHNGSKARFPAWCSSI